MKKFFLTTPIYYLNAPPHLGHAYTSVVADIIVRFKKSMSYEVGFQTGSDEHGEKILKKAQELSLTPQELIEKNKKIFKTLLQKLDVKGYHFYQTSSPLHKRLVQKTFTSLLQSGDIYAAEYEGDYCVTCEEYVNSKTNSLLKGSAFCPTCSSPLRKLQEEAFFLRVTKHYPWLKRHLQKNSDFILPEKIRNLILNNFLGEDRRDLCVTRRSLNWGIKVPQRPDLTIYVWFDALLNYVNSPEGKKSFSDKKTEKLQIVGKDIARFHGVYWPIILRVLNLNLPSKLLVHGWILNRGEKMSKSKGNVLDPFELLAKFPSDVLRAYFVAKMSFLQDGEVTPEGLESFYSDFLVKDLGNLVSRSFRLLQIYEKHPNSRSSSDNEPLLRDYRQEVQAIVKEFRESMNSYKLSLAFELLERLVKKTNKLINDFSPWKKEEWQNSWRATFLSHLNNGLKTIAFLSSFFMPRTSKRIASLFASNSDQNSWKNCLNFSFASSSPLKKRVSPHLFPKINHIN